MPAEHGLHPPAAVVLAECVRPQRRRSVRWEAATFAVVMSLDRSPTVLAAGCQRCEAWRRLLELDTGVYASCRVLSVPVGAGASELEDVQDECAWRMGQWTAADAEGDQPAEVAAVRGRFNYAVLRMLRALSEGDRAGCRELLTCARQVRTPAQLKRMRRLR